MKNKTTEFQILPDLMWLSFFPLWGLGMLRNWSPESLFIAIFFLLIYIYHLTLFYRVKNWLPIEGSYDDFFIIFIVIRGARYAPDNMYRPSFNYSYQVDGITYKNDRLGIFKQDHEVGSEEEAQRVVRVNKKKHTLTVYYNPKNPQESMLLAFFSFRKRLQLYTLLFFASTLILKEFFSTYFPEPFYVYLIELLK